MNELQNYTAARIAAIREMPELLHIKKMADAAQIFYDAQDEWEAAQHTKEISMRVTLQAGFVYDDAPKQSGGDRSKTTASAVLTTKKQKIIKQAEDAGISQRTLEDWARWSRAMDRLDEYFVARPVDSFREWSFADFSRFAFMHIPESTGDEWYTPKEYIDSAKSVLGEIDLDPASSEQANRTVRAKHIFTKEDSGLEHEWRGRVFMNPPYSKNKPFAERLIAQYEVGNISEAIVLVSAHGIETQWFCPFWDHVLCFTGHRIKFVTPEGIQMAGNINGSVFVYFGMQEQAFADEFIQHGYVVKRWP